MKLEYEEETLPDGSVTLKIGDNQYKDNHPNYDMLEEHLEFNDAYVASTMRAVVDAGIKQLKDNGKAVIIRAKAPYQINDTLNTRITKQGKLVSVVNRGEERAKAATLIQKEEQKRYQDTLDSLENDDDK